MSESNNNVPMRITQLQEAETFDYESYLASAKAGTGTKKVKGSTLLAELTNIRVGANGETYPTAGDAVRGQISGLQNIIDNYGYYEKNVSITWQQGNYTPSGGGYVSSSTRCCSDTYISVKSSTKYKISDSLGDKDFRLTFFDSNGNMIETNSNTNWSSGTLEVVSPSNAAICGVSVRYHNDATIAPSNCINIKFLEIYDAGETIFVKEEYYKYVTQENNYNLFNENTINYGYITATGGIETFYGENAIYTDFMEINPLNDYTFKSEYVFLGVGFCWYDENRVFISRDNIFPNTEQEITKTPVNNAKYLIITLLSALSTVDAPIDTEMLRFNETMLTLDYNANKEYIPYYGTAIDYVSRKANNNIYKEYNKKIISILGDSISTFAGDNPESAGDGHTIADGTYTYEGNHCRYPNSYLSNVNQTYWKMLIDNLEMNLGVNDSWAGSRVSWNGTESSDQGANIYIASQTRINHLGANGTPDFILVNAGTNDIGANVTVGTFNTENPVNYTDEQIAALPVATFADAYRALLIRLQKKYPLARIIVLLPNYTTSYYNPTNADIYLEIIKEACDFFGVPWVDMRTTGITMYNTGTYTGDGIHPNPKGMNYLYEKVDKFFKYIL